MLNLVQRLCQTLTNVVSDPEVPAHYINEVGPIIREAELAIRNEKKKETNGEPQRK